ncbi:hypothetical protein KXE51_003379 [Salmonella enterica]|nr:hypothetical protein [Salmonella enterica]
MITANITIYAFDTFSKFDSFASSAFGIKEVKATEFSGGNGRLAKFANTKLPLPDFTKALEGHIDAEVIHASLLKKDGTPRKLVGNSRIYDADGFTVSVLFTAEPVSYEVLSNSSDTTHYVVTKGETRPVFETGDITAAIKEMNRLNQANLF